MAISFDNIRTGHFYHLRNYGEVSEFEVMDIREKNDFILKDIVTGEVYKLSDLLRYGKSNDFELFELRGS